jgi:hypothetical protein
MSVCQCVIEHWFDFGINVRILPKMISLSLKVISHGLDFFGMLYVLYANGFVPCCIYCVNRERLSLFSITMSSSVVNHKGFLPFGRNCSLGERCCHSRRLTLSEVQSCSRKSICRFLSCFLKVV